MSKISRAIIIFPKFDNIHYLEQLRKEYDPLADVIDPHITLVFPFESDLSSEQLRILIKQAIQGIRPFLIQLQCITGSEGEYLFLNIKVGNDQIIELHDRLYTSLLQSRLSREQTFVPHLTVGRLNNRNAFFTALEITQNMNVVFQTVITDLTLVRVGGNYPIEACFELKKQDGSQL